jgi:hypothetical protein
MLKTRFVYPMQPVNLLGKSDLLISSRGGARSRSFFADEAGEVKMANIFGPEIERWGLDDDLNELWPAQKGIFVAPNDPCPTGSPIPGYRSATKCRAFLS